MLTRRIILRFTCLVVVVYVLLMIPWAGRESAYARVFRSFGDTVFTRFWFWGDGHVRFLDLHSEFLKEDLDDATPGKLPATFKPLPPDEVMDTLMAVMNRSKPAIFGQQRISSRIVGYWPTAWLIALIIAKPLPWARKGWAFVWGLVLIHAFIAFRLSLTIASEGFGANKAYALFQLSPFWKDILGRAETVFVTNPTVSFVVPTFIWLVVAFKWSEWASFRNALHAPADDQ